MATSGRPSTASDMHDTAVIMALLSVVRNQEHHVGIAFVDITRRVIGMAEFLDDDQYTNLESAIVGLGCRECVVPIEKSPKLHDVMARCNVVLTQRKRAEFKARDVEQDLSRLVKCSIEQVRNSVATSEAAAAALAALVLYTDLLADDSNYGRYILQPYSLDSHMRLDAAALRALNVLESKTDLNKNFSLFGLMNRTCTAGMGKRLLNRWLKQPLVDVVQIQQRHDIVQIFVESAELRETMRQCLRHIPDIERLSRKLEKKKATLQDIVKLFQASVRLPFIKKALENYAGQFRAYVEENYVQRLEEWSDADHLGRYDALVEAAIDLDQAKSGEYMIAPDYDSNLKRIRAERDSVDDQIRQVHQQAASDLDLPGDKSLKLDKSSQWGHVFRITKKDEPKVRKKLTAQYVTLETRKDGIKFTNSKLRRLSDQYQKLTEEYSELQKDLISRVVEVASTFVEVFDGVASVLSEVDVLQSFADLVVSSPTPYVRPLITSGNEGNIILEGSRHPCVEAQEDVNFIPNDCRLIRGKSWFQIITGPNMGGKSTFIRQIGVNVLMAQVGCFVPCEHAEISVRSCVFARVGAGDCQMRGVSTFMSEMLETAAILKSATENALIIIDELGRGTSTFDGFGLAWAICEYLVEVTRAPTLFATHFHELTAIAHKKGERGVPVGIANYHVTAHVDPTSHKLAMLYKVEEGPCDQSFGIHVAEVAHFPECVLAIAKQKAAELEDFSPQMKEKKRKRENENENEGIERGWKFVREFAELPLDSMNEVEAMNEFDKLKSSLMEDAANKFPSLLHLLST